MQQQQQEKESVAQDTLGKQLKKHSSEIIEEMTNEVVLAAKKITSIFLGDAFQNIFSLEKSCQYSGPVAFEMGGNTDQILYDRLNPRQIEKLPFYIMNGDVLCKSYNPMREFNFVVLIDMSMSMLYRWPLIKLAASDRYLSIEEVEAIKDQCRKTKLYALKYLAYTFLDSAIENKFSTSVTFFSNQTLHEASTVADKRFSDFVLSHIDGHFAKVYAKAISTDHYQEKSSYLKALLNFIYKRKKCFVLFLSDFLDGIEDLKPYLIELNYKSPLIMAVINDPYEINFPSRKFVTPVTVSHEHCKDLEQDLEGGVRLSNKTIREYNARSTRRREEMFDFFSQRKIRYLDIQTQDNSTIPQKLQKFNAQLLEAT